ncbi:hypothetical protein NO2_0037 [Candidatus Termititenax persephonae]|uniref:Uncharacterized protein n=1 Tax=Candidatus Termititenax persephonae TaxID=2218525 RepID=A0A388TEV6_9BACT|nr:hypothetical protein NO2_0037 [Candidatus Termititenax persephonae]
MGINVGKEGQVFMVKLRLKPQRIALEDIVRRQEMAKYGQVVSAFKPMVSRRAVNGPTIVAIE